LVTPRVRNYEWKY